MNFEGKLKMLRKESNLTQEELAEKLCVSRQAITKWENGDGLPDIDNLKEISRLFKVSIDELIKEEKVVNLDNLNTFTYEEELDIDHIKHFDIKIGNNKEINILPNDIEKIHIEIISSLESDFKVKFDDLYNKIDIDIKNSKELEDAKINLYIPEKYIEEIELKSKSRILNISNLFIDKLEYDGELKYLNISNSKGRIVLNTSKCDIEANYDMFNGVLEVNTINSVSRVSIPKGTLYKTVIKGIKNNIIDANSQEESDNIIELNGVGSKLIIIEK